MSRKADIQSIQRDSAEVYSSLIGAQDFVESTTESDYSSYELKKLSLAWSKARKSMEAINKQLFSIYGRRKEEDGVDILERYIDEQNRIKARNEILSAASNNQVIL